VFTGSTFPVTENGTYTIYVEDEAGNGAIDTITIENIVLKGDVEGLVEFDWDIDLFDWQKVANFIVEKEIPNARETFAADMNDDSSIDVADWVAIANKIIEQTED